MKIIFLGTPRFAEYVLKELNLSDHKVVAVVTQPDKRIGRGSSLGLSPVKKFALENNIKLLQFKNIKSNDALDKLKETNADILVTCAYGQLLNQKVLDIKKHGVINTHASILPKYRGAAPIQWAIINGENKTGVSIMQTDIGMDTGDVILTKSIEIKENETAGELTERLMPLSAQALIEALDEIENSVAKFLPQDNNQSSHYPLLKKNDGLIDFNKTANDIKNLVRGLNPWPGAYTYINGKYCKVHIVSKYNEEIDTKINGNGQVVFADRKKGLIVKVKDGYIRLEQIQMFGSKKILDIDFLNGNMIQPGLLVGEKNE